MTGSGFPSLTGVIGGIAPPDPLLLEKAQQRLNSLTKPTGSLGRLESLAAKYFAIASGEIPLSLSPAVYVFAADHGVSEERVSAYPREVTAQMVRNFLGGGAAVNVLARLHGARLTVVDVGVDAEFEEHPDLVRAKVRCGSRNLVREAAMTPSELSAALQTGIDLATSAHNYGSSIVVVGEMGIGNTTAASAITAVLLQRATGEVTGRGAGLTDAGRNNKLNVIRRSLRRHFPESVGAPEPLEILRCVGGLEIAAMTGFILSAARHRMPVMLDGFISTAAAAIAYSLCPAVREYLFAGHCSQEPGHRYLLRHLELQPILTLDMRLGEGTGAILALPVLESALHLFAEMATFSSAGVSTAAE